MILVTIEYDQNWFNTAAIDQFHKSGLVDLFPERALQTLSENVEAIAGLVFAEELAHVDVRCRAFGEADQFEEPLFITIDVEDKEMLHDPSDLADQFCVHFRAQLAAIIGRDVSLRVWVRRIYGSYSESRPTSTLKGLR